MGKRMTQTRIKKRIVLSAALSLYALLACLTLGPARAQGPDETAWPTKGWLTSTPEEQGMDSSALAKLVGYGASHSFDSLLVARHGRIVAEAYCAPYTGDIPHEISSSIKAVTGTLLGMVYKDGLLDRLDRPMLTRRVGKNRLMANRAIDAATSPANHRASKPGSPWGST